MTCTLSFSRRGMGWGLIIGKTSLFCDCHGRFTPSQWHISCGLCPPITAWPPDFLTSGSLHKRPWNEFRVTVWYSPPLRGGEYKGRVMFCDCDGCFTRWQWHISLRGLCPPITACPPDLLTFWPPLIRAWNKFRMTENLNLSENSVPVRVSGGGGSVLLIIKHIYLQKLAFL